MKYKIEGIEASETIKSTQVINTKNKKVIMVNYLDGTQDVFELNDDILNKIETMMNYQAKKYCKAKKTGFNFTTEKMIFLIFASCFASLGIAFSLANSTIPAIVSACLTWAFGALIAKTRAKEKYYLKYKLYLDSTNKKMQEYKDILKKEKQLSLSKSKSNNCKINNIGDLDKVSYKYVKSIDEKVDRYNEINKAKTKTLENSSLY